MAQKEVVILDPIMPSLDVPQAGDTYLMPTDVSVVGDISVSGTVDGRDVGTDGSVLDAHTANTSNPHAVTVAQLGIVLPGVDWTIRESTADNGWIAITYGNGLFVAVAYSGINGVMTSPDGVNWTSSVPAAYNIWTSITYGNGLFVAVSNTGTGNRVMTSPDGVNWTSRVPAADNNWSAITYGNGLFVAVAYSGTGNRVMTSGAPELGVVPNDNTALGAGQNWQNLMSSRAAGVTYTNTTGNTIAISVVASGTADLLLTVGGLTIQHASSSIASVSGVIPHGATYSVTLSSGTLSSWAELRQ